MTSRWCYYRRLFRLFRSYRRRDGVVPAPPLRLWVELSSRCNLACVMCPNRELEASAKGEMSEGIFSRVIAEAADFAFEVSLHHRGESLLHPRVVECVEEAVRSGLVTKLHTNGMLLDEKMALGLVEAGLHRLSFSFDGFVADDYEKIRRGADFDLVVANIRRLLQIRRERGRRRPQVAIELIQLAPGQVERGKKRSFLERFRGLELDQVIVKRPHNWAGSISKAIPHGHYSPCTFPWNAMVLLWNGDVCSCTQDFFGLQVVGKIGQAPLLEIWNDEPMRRLRRTLGEARHSEYSACRDCDRLWRDRFLGIPKEYLKPLLLRKMP